MAIFNEWLVLGMISVTSACFAASNPVSPESTTDLTENDLAKSAKKEDSSKPCVIVKTSLGTFELELYADKTPVTVDNFLRYVDEGFYNGTCFHRVMSDFMIQGGGFTREMEQKPTHSPIINEAEKGVPNERGVIAMARLNDPNSATCQFFINVVNNDFLNFSSNTPWGYGYCGFGRVTTGLEVLDKIRIVKTGSKGGHQDVPVEPVMIESITRKG